MPDCFGPGWIPSLEIDDVYYIENSAAFERFERAHNRNHAGDQLCLDVAVNLLLGLSLLSALALLDRLLCDIARTICKPGLYRYRVTTKSTRGNHRHTPTPQSSSHESPAHSITGS
jgi:hypothetical protein